MTVFSYSLRRFLHISHLGYSKSIPIASKTSLFTNYPRSLYKLFTPSTVFAV